MVIHTNCCMHCRNCRWSSAQLQLMFEFIHTAYVKGCTMRCIWSKIARHDTAQFPLYTRINEDVMFAGTTTRCCSLFDYTVIYNPPCFRHWGLAHRSAVPLLQRPPMFADCSQTVCQPCVLFHYFTCKWQHVQNTVTDVEVFHKLQVNTE